MMAQSDDERTTPAGPRFAVLLGPLARWRGPLIALGAIVGALVVVFGGGLVLAPRPSSCLGCHEMEAHYAQWATSTHKEVICIDCHTEPGLPGVVKIEASMLKNSAAHLTGTYELPIRAEVRDESCLRCHPRESRPEVLPQATLRISHSSHNDITCAQCHGRLVHTLGQETTMPAVTHKGGEKACEVCHTPDVATHGPAQVDCQSCHSGSIPRHSLREQSNVLTREGCIDCHNKMRVSAEEKCQTCHVSPHGIDRSCNKCHTSTDTWQDKQLVHPFPLEGAHASLACTKCHLGNGSTSANVTKASVPAQLPQAIKTPQGNRTPDCSSCHQPPHKPFGDNNCTSCHNPNGWRPVKVDSASLNHKQIWDGYVGKHAAASCDSCHKNGAYAGTSPTCAGCHQPKQQPHFGTECGSCHQTGASFKRT